MNNYLKIFQEEAKNLLNSYKNKNPVAVKRCKKVFGERTDLTLMNMQHVIAKEYGFNQWNDIRRACNSEQAEVLVKHVAKGFTSPLTQWFGNKIILEDVENNRKKLCTDDKHINWNDLIVKEPYQSINLSNMDVSGRNLLTLNLLDTTFTDDTLWPQNKSFLPKGISPEKFLEERKNPGLGIKTLHSQGIKGKGRNVVVISQSGLGDHIEYHHNLMDYIEITDDKIVGSFRGNGDVSGIVGRTCGVAPESHLYYISVQTSNRSLVKYVQAIQLACKIHKDLIKNRQNGIDVIVMRMGVNSTAFKYDEGYLDVLNAIKEAEEMGIFIKTGADEAFGYKIVGTYCQMGGDIENPMDYEIQTFWNLLKIRPEIYKNQKIIYFPGQWTVAGNLKMNGFVFDKVVPSVNAYVAGLYLLAKSVNENLSPSEFYDICYETGDEGNNVGRIVNPLKVINYLKK